jgi:hypothetical protein
MAEDRSHLKFEAIRRALHAMWDVPFMTVPGYSRVMWLHAAPLGLKGPGPGGFPKWPY